MTQMLTEPKNTAIEWVVRNEQDLSDWNQIIFAYGETAWREASGQQ